MTKKKSIFIKLFVALVALTLISCCFLGSTFARYTSGGNGSATTTVANWKIDITGDGTGESQVSIGDLEPAAIAYAGTPRSNTLEAVQIAKIENKGEVAATVTFTLGEMKIYGLESGTNNASETELENYGSYSYGAVSGLFDVKLYYTTDDSFSATNGITSGSEIGAALEAGQSYYIWMQVTWNSDDTNSNTDEGRAADALDTWVGQNVGALGWTLSYEAVQAVS